MFLRPYSCFPKGWWFCIQDRKWRLNSCRLEPQHEHISRVQSFTAKEDWQSGYSECCCKESWNREIPMPSIRRVQPISLSPCLNPLPLTGHSEQQIYKAWLPVITWWDRACQERKEATPLKSKGVWPTAHHLWKINIIKSIPSLDGVQAAKVNEARQEQPAGYTLNFCVQDFRHASSHVILYSADFCMVGNHSY